MQCKQRSLALYRSFLLFTSFALLLLVATACAASETETVVHTFAVQLNGAYPQSALLAGGSGNFYGSTLQGGMYGNGTVFELSPLPKGGYKQIVLHNFDSNVDGYEPGPLVADSAGNLYGSLNRSTKLANGGAVFKLTRGPKGTWLETIVFTFDGSAGPTGILNFDHAGNLYGVNAYGGANNWGAVYELTPSSQGKWLESTLHNFTNMADGGYPDGGLTFDSSGDIYGTASSGGDPQCNPFGGRNTTCGIVFKLSNNGNGTWTESTLLIFNYTNGAYPTGGLTLDSVGNLYGTTYNGPAPGGGVVYRLSPNPDDTWTQSILYTFKGGPDAATPNGSLLLDSQGNFYGTSQNGGSASCNCGTVFEISPSKGPYWKEKILYRFSGGVLEESPLGGLVVDSLGNLYGTASGNPSGNGICYVQFGCNGSVFKLSPSAGGKWNASAVFAFSTGNDGIIPTTALISDSAGNLYGSTASGGNYLCGQVGCGSIFELSPNGSGGWSESALYDFTTGLQFNGYSPSPNLAVDSTGNLYGTTVYGGDAICNCGEVFELSPTTGGVWQQRVLYTFLGGPDGYNPYAGVALAPNGKIYGTAGGGVFQKNEVFELTQNSSGVWTERTIFSFDGRDGTAPNALVLDAAGDLYGSTQYGGSSGACYDGCGVVFELSHGAGGKWAQNILYSFSGNSDGSYPSPVVLDSAGNLYGTTVSGGGDVHYCPYNGGCGTVFEISKTAGKTTLYSFHPLSVPGDGAAPIGGVTLDAVGNLYGTTSAGGTMLCQYYYTYPPGCGTVFELSPTGDSQWTETILHDFAGSDGWDPVAVPFVDSAGNVIGSAALGGNQDWGVIYEISARSKAETKQSPTHRRYSKVNQPRYTRPSPITTHGSANFPGSAIVVPAPAPKEIR
jgi:uncharacterized repeat protein (TIGR03803 family)